MKSRFLYLACSGIEADVDDLAKRRFGKSRNTLLAAFLPSVLQYEDEKMEMHRFFVVMAGWLSFYAYAQ
jgi:hypothetical protein